MVYPIIFQPAAFNTCNARKVTHGLGSFIFPNLTGFDVRGIIIRDEHGTAIRRIGTNQDVTEQRQIDELLDTPKSNCRLALVYLFKVLDIIIFLKWTPIFLIILKT